MASDQACRSRLEAFRPLGDLAKNEHRLAQGGRLFLEAARIRQDEKRAPEQVGHFDVAQRGQQRDAGDPVQRGGHGLPHLGIGMHGEHDMGASRKPRGELTQRGADPRERRPEALPAMGGGQHEAYRRREVGQARSARCEGLVERPTQCVDDGVPGDDDAFVGHTFAQQVLPRGGRGGAMQVGEHAGRAAVQLLGKRPPLVSTAQARLDVGQWNPGVVRGEGGGGGGGGVALDDHPVRRLRAQHRLQPLEDGRRHRDGRLALFHHVQVVVEGDAEPVEHGRRQLAMLRGQADARVHAAALRLEDDGGELDRLRPRADHEKDAHVRRLRRRGPGGRRVPGAHVPGPGASG